MTGYDEEAFAVWRRAESVRCLCRVSQSCHTDQGDGSRRKRGKGGAQAYCRSGGEKGPGRGRVLPKNTKPSDEFLGSNDLQLGAGGNLRGEMPCIGCEEPVRSRPEGRYKDRDVCLVTDQMAMQAHLLLAWKGNRFWLEKLQ
jgi:hypothetical protein